MSSLSHPPSLLDGARTLRQNTSVIAAAFQRIGEPQGLALEALNWDLDLLISALERGPNLESLEGRILNALARRLTSEIQRLEHHLVITVGFSWRQGASPEA